MLKTGKPLPITNQATPTSTSEAAGSSTRVAGLDLSFSAEEEVHPSEWLAGLPQHVRLNRPIPWIMMGLSGMPIPYTYEIIAKFHESRKRKWASDAFDEAINRQLEAWKSPRHPSQNIFQPAPYLFDVLVLWAAKCSYCLTPQSLDTEDDRLLYTVLASYEIIEGILGDAQQAIFVGDAPLNEIADVFAEDICRAIAGVSNPTMDDDEGDPQ